MNLFCRQAPGAMQIHICAEGEAEWPITVSVVWGPQRREVTRSKREQMSSRIAAPSYPRLQWSLGAGNKVWMAHWGPEYWLPVWATSPLKKQMGSFRQKPAWRHQDTSDCHWPQVEQEGPITSGKSQALDGMLGRALGTFREGHKCWV